MLFNSFITSAESLVTTHEQTRAGFLSIALEKIKSETLTLKMLWHLRQW